MAVRAPLELLDHKTCGAGLPATVAPFTGYRRVFPPQRKPRCGMIEPGGDTRSPSCRGMATLTRLFEFAPMWIGVARQQHVANFSPV